MDFIDDVVGRGRSGRQANYSCSLKPLVVEFRDMRHLVGRLTEPARQLGQFAAIIAIWTTDHNHDIALGGQTFQS